MPHYLTESQVLELAHATHGFVGADIAALCKEAALVCLRRVKLGTIINTFKSSTL